MRLRAVITALTFALAACATPPGQVRNMNHEVDLHGYRSYSWGKANVNFKDYTHVVWVCTSRGVLSATAPKELEFDVGNADGTDTGVADRAEEARMAQAREEMRQRHAIIDNCLTEFGFHRFGLNNEQLAR
ncbi:MAG: hypothetical protein ABUS57_08130, partial [Pseudomonadota bacterium]